MPKRTARRLSRFSERHLRYEIDMLFATGQALHRTRPGFVQYALLESFALHLRALIEFPYGEKRQDDDVGAEEYVADEKAWLRDRKALPRRLAAARTRANKQMAHLTLKRYQTGPRKAWPVGQLMRDIAVPLGVFAKHAVRSRLHPTVRNLFAKR